MPLIDIEDSQTDFRKKPLALELAISCIGFI